MAIGERHGVRLLGPNIYGYYSTWQDLCATFCTPYDVKGGVALTSQSGGIGMAILGFARTTKTGVSAIVGLGNKSDLDEDDLLTWFGEDPNTECIAMHLEDLKDGRAFVEAAQGDRTQEAGRRPQGRPYGGGREGRRLAHGRAGGRRRRVRRHPAAGRRHPGARASTRCWSTRGRCPCCPPRRATTS